MRITYRVYLLLLFSTLYFFRADGQSMHFSQYYNAPMLLNPANTALMSDNDYRLGANYRNQWAAIPVPYNTMSAYGDLKIGGGSESEHTHWLGLGGAIFSDKAGSGHLSLLQMQGSVAYHIKLSTHSMLSFGGSGAYIQRSINYDDLSFDTQWDGFSFNSRMPNGEKIGILRTSYSTVAAGANIAFFPNDAVYIKLGGGMANINQPVESFYGGTNQVGMRPTLNLDMLFRTSKDVIVNPSVYFTTQNGAAEIVAGSLTRINMNKSGDGYASELILGLFDRIGDAIIGVAGYQVGDVQFMANYDFTTSTLAPYNGAFGALEFSVVYGGNYYKNKGLTKMYGCPRF